jgi:hypothetical protein
MNDTNNHNNAVEIIPAPYSPADPDEKTTEGRKEERMGHAEETAREPESGLESETEGNADTQHENDHIDEREKGHDAKDAANKGHNGNPAQSAARVTSHEQDSHLEEPIESEGNTKNSEDRLSDQTPQGQH